jgi:hypothetical protein
VSEIENDLSASKVSRRATPANRAEMLDIFKSLLAITKFYGSFVTRRASTT